MVLKSVLLLVLERAYQTFIISTEEVADQIRSNYRVIMKPEMVIVDGTTKSPLIL
jgi:hypothetical protein